MESEAFKLPTSTKTENQYNSEELLEIQMYKFDTNTRLVHLRWQLSGQNTESSLANQSLLAEFVIRTESCRVSTDSRSTGGIFLLTVAKKLVVPFSNEMSRLLPSKYILCFQHRPNSTLDAFFCGDVAKSVKERTSNAESKFDG